MFGIENTKLKMLVSASILSLSVMAIVPEAHAGLGDGKGNDLLVEAQNYYDDGKLQAAIIELKNALKADPSLKEARLLLGDAYLKVGNGASAEKEFEYARKLGVADADLLVRLGKAYLLQSKFTDIQKMSLLDKVRGDDKAEAHLIVGDAFKGQGDDAAAMENYLAGEVLRPEDPQIKVGLARIYLSKGEMELAEQKVGEALAIAPANVGALIVKGEQVRANGDVKGSVSYFEAALEQEPENLTALLEYAASLVELQRDDEARAALEKIYARVPKHPLALYFSAVIETRNNNNAQAINLLDKAGPALDNFVPALLLKGVINYAQENYAQSVYFLSRLVDIMPGHVAARRVLGAALLRQGEPRQAIDAMTPLVKAGLDDGKIFALMGSAHMQLGDYNKGSEYYARAVEMEPSVDTLKTQLAISKLAKGDTAGATSELEGVVGDSPDAQQAGVLLSLIALREQKFDEALMQASRLIEQNKDNPIGYNLKGAALIGKEDLVGARQAFSAALDVKADFYSAMMNLAQVDLREGKVDAARGRYENILSQDKENVMALMGMVNLLHKQEKLDESVSYLERAISADPSRIDTRIKLSETYLGLQENEKAKGVAQQLTQDFSDQAAGYEALGKINMLMGDNKGAVVNFQQLSVILADNPGAYQLLGRAQWASEDIAGARKSLSKAFALANEADNKSLQIEMLADLSRLEVSQKQYAKALEYAKQAEALNPNSPAGPVLRGRVHAAENNNAAALSAYLDGQKRGATGTQFIIELARTQQATGDINTAEKTLFAWLDKHPEDLMARHSIASIYLQMGKYEYAADAYEKIVSANEQDALALNNLAWIYSQVGNAKALSTAQAAYGLAKENPAIMDTYGWLLLQDGQVDAALKILQKAAALAGSNPEIRYHLAVALHENGNDRAAQSELEAILSQGISFNGDKDAMELLKKIKK